MSFTVIGLIIPGSVLPGYFVLESAALDAGLTQIRDAHSYEEIQTQMYSHHIQIGKIHSLFENFDVSTLHQNVKKSTAKLIVLQYAESVPVLSGRLVENDLNQFK